MKYQTFIFESTQALDDFLNSLKGKFEVVSVSCSNKLQVFLTIKK